jgi:hypothetical protein
METSTNNLFYCNQCLHNNTHIFFPDYILNDIELYNSVYDLIVLLDVINVSFQSNSLLISLKIEVDHLTISFEDEGANLFYKSLNKYDTQSILNLIVVLKKQFFCH